MEPWNTGIDAVIFSKTPDRDYVLHLRSGQIQSNDWKLENNQVFLNRLV